MGVANGENGRPEGSMGVDAADYDGTGRLSIFVANFQGEFHALYRNNGPGQPFHHASVRTGIAAPSVVDGKSPFASVKSRP